MNPVSRVSIRVLGPLLFATPLAAQVGHAPTSSPYRDIRQGTAWEITGGTIKGSGGPIGVGPRDGSMAGLRVMLRANSTLSLGLGAWASQTERTVLDPNAAPAQQVVGTRDAHLIGGEMVVQFNLTGGKSWHGFAPFTGIGLGLVHNTSGDVADPGGYEFGTKFYFAPMIGARFVASKRLYLRVEGRGFTWKLKYPFLYGVEPANAPGTAEAPNAIDPLGRDGQYVVAPALSVGLGISF
ncbi:MAG TPA: hypothetical protein VFN22_02030 [Gemmatimonadales bacterium]|nr:hypothetical protein [Gemmatimonadales bacterium]